MEIIERVDGVEAFKSFDVSGVFEFIKEAGFWVIGVTDHNVLETGAGLDDGASSLHFTGELDVGGEGSEVVHASEASTGIAVAPTPGVDIPFFFLDVFVDLIHCQGEGDFDLMDGIECQSTPDRLSCDLDHDDIPSPIDECLLHVGRGCWDRMETVGDHIQEAGVEMILIIMMILIFFGG